MAKRGKKFVNMAKKATVATLPLIEAIKSAKKNSYSSFEGSMELHVAINVPKDKDAKSLKGSIVLPHSIAKAVRIAVFTTPENVQAAKNAGADLVGLEELIKSIKAGAIDFDIAIATPDVMPKIAILGKELGPKGLMPSPKNGTVSTDVSKTIEEYKKGKLNFACDTTGAFHFMVGKVSLEDEKIVENVNACLAKTVELVGKQLNTAVKTVYIAPTMGKSVRVKMDSLQ